MPEFALGGIAGFDGTLLLPDGGSPTTVALRLTDPLLHLPRGEQQSFSAQARSVNSGTRIELELAAVLPVPRELCGGQLRLRRLEVALRFEPGSGTSGDRLGREQLVSAEATGSITWVGGELLGVADGVPLNVRYELDGSSGSGFELSLANAPFVVTGGLVQISDASLEVALFPERSSFVIGLSGGAMLTDAGATQASQLLTQIFPAAPGMKALKFGFRRELQLLDGVISASSPELGSPEFRLDFDWQQPARPTLSGMAELENRLDLSIGLPSLAFPLGNGTPSQWQLRLRETTLRVKGVQGFDAFQLLGDLDLESGPEPALRFRPKESGNIELPGFVRAFLSRLGWGPGAALVEIADLAAQSQTEFEWSTLFRGLLPEPIPSSGAGLAALRSELALNLEALLATAFDSKHAFTLVFQAIGGASPAVSGLLWEEWFARQPDADVSQLPAQLVALASLPEAGFASLLDGLFHQQFPVRELATSFVTEWATSFADFGRYADTWLRLSLHAALQLQAPRFDELVSGFLTPLSDRSQPELSALHDPQSIGRPDLAAADGAARPASNIILAAATTGPVTQTSSTAASRGDPSVRDLLVSWKQFFRGNGGSNPPTTEARGLGVWLRAIVGKVENEEWLATQASESRLLGMLLILVLLPKRALGEPLRFWKLLTTEVEADTDWKTKRLPPASEDQKYLILSDIHRDARSDDQGAFKVGSIDHFKANARLYCRILDWAAKTRHVVIEAGDCEELWYIRDAARHVEEVDGKAGMLRKMREIIETYSSPHSSPDLDVFGRLSRLHAEERYIRIQGNHDSFLYPHNDTNPIFKLLAEEMGRDNTTPFEIFDACIIEDVKQMTEQSWFDLLEELGSGEGNTGEEQASILKRLLRGRLGMDSNDYNERCPMLIAHGHQFDFYNCRENQILGLLMSNTVGTLVDRNMDPFLDLKGLAIGGSPCLDIGDMFASTPLLDIWPDEQNAVAFAHRLQHMRDRDRRLVDSMFFDESMAALIGCYGLALNYSDPNDPDGALITPQQSRDEINLKTPAGMFEYVRRHHNHHLCLGHTHNPQSQPYFSVENLPAVLGPVSSLLQKLGGLLPFEILVKSKYFNSGTAGWMEGVVWAIEIDGTGQARLIYWTNNSRNPEYMDWELQPFDPELKEKLLEEWRNVLPNLADDATGGDLDLDELFKELNEHLGRFRTDLKEVGDAIGAKLVIPMVMLARALTRQGREMSERVLKETSNVLGDFKVQADRVRALLFDVLMAMRRRTLRTPTDTESFQIKAPISPRVREDLLALKDVMIELGDTDPQSALHVAGVALSSLQTFPRKVPFFGGFGNLLHPERTLRDTEAPVLHSLLSVLRYFPPQGSPPVAMHGNELTSRFELADDGNSVLLTVTQAPTQVRA